MQIRYLLESGKAEEAELLRFPVSPLSVAFSAADGDAGADAGAAGAADVGAAGAGDGGGGGGAKDGGGGDGGGESETSSAEEKAKADMRETQRLVDIARGLSERGLLISVRLLAHARACAFVCGCVRAGVCAARSC